MPEGKARPKLTSILPANLPLIQGTLLEGTTTFQYWIAGENEGRKIELAGRTPDTFEGVTRFNDENGVRFEILSPLKFFVEEKNWQAKDPRTGAVLDKAAAEKIKREVAELNLQESVTLSSDFRDVAEGKTPGRKIEQEQRMETEKQAASKKADDQKKEDSKGMANVPGATPGPGMKPEDSPPPRPLDPNAPRVIKGGGGFAGWIFIKNDRAKGWVSQRELRTQFESEKDRDGDIRTWINQSNFPKGSSYYINSDGKVVVTPP